MTYITGFYLLRGYRFTCLGTQSVIFDATESIDYGLENVSVNETNFIAWMEQNKTDENVQKVLYHEFLKHYVWKQEQRIWLPR